MNWGAIGSIVAIIGLTFGVGTWVKSLDEEITDLHVKIEKLELGSKIPVGSVLALNSNKCPEGWSSYPKLSGRTIIGVGSGTGLTPRQLGDSGGEEKVALVKEELPSHTHLVEGVAIYDAKPTPNTTRVFSPHPRPQFEESSIAAGDGIAHNNMQPYVALLYCKKE
ncbi:MAG: hypothetical protein AB2704_26050 [Candidatus Thiodiazotropha taylori]